MSRIAILLLLAFGSAAAQAPSEKRIRKHLIINHANGPVHLVKGISTDRAFYERVEVKNVSNRTIETVTFAMWLGPGNVHDGQIASGVSIGPGNNDWGLM